MSSGLDSQLQSIRTLPLDKLKVTYQDQIPTDLAPYPSFWASYQDLELAIGLRTCLAVLKASENKIVTNEFQLKATIAMMSGQDSLIDVWTGYSKTLCMIIPCLLAPESISIIISPLKRLQAVHVLEFERYGIKTISINEETPNNPELWKNIADGNSWFSLNNSRRLLDTCRVSHD